MLPSIFASFVAKAVKASGGFIYGPGSVPKGIDVFHDIQRYRWPGSLPSRSASLILDVGANIGQFASAALKGLPTCSVISFEPVTNSFDQLKLNASSNTRWTVVNTAVGNASGTVEITSVGTSTMNHVRRSGEKVDEGGTELVPIIRLDDYCKEHGINSIDVLKTDTEGFDAEVLRGAAELLSSKAIQSVFVELCFDEHDLGHTSFFEVAALLGPEFKVAGFYGQGCDGPGCNIDRVDVLFINTEKPRLHPLAMSVF